MRDFVTVVSGLPRSGTSLMMQMLQAGGLPPLTDGTRPADPDNPRGYFEYEPVKRLRQDASWVGGAVGRAVKVVHLLLPDLPPGHEYRALLMRRDLAEVVRSQRVMLERSGKKGAALGDEQLAAVFAQQLAKVEAWLAAQPHFRVLEVPHRDAVTDPAAVAARVADFLGGGLDVEAMARAVDPALYRQRGPISDPAAP
jgi:hypothetical protein